MDLDGQTDLIFPQTQKGNSTRQTHLFMLYTLNSNNKSDEIFGQ